MTYAFLDTNLLMHFKVFEGIDWPMMLGDKDYSLIICPTVLDEIDKHKDNSTKSRKRNRAKAVFKILSDYLDGKSKNNVNLDFCYDSPNVDINSSQYNGAREDDYIIAYATAFNKSGRKVVVSNDIGMKFRAKKAGLDFLMPESSPQNLLSHEPTEEELLIKELQSKVYKYENRMAKPILLFKNEKDEITFQSFQYPNYDELIELENNLKASFPLKKRPTANTLLEQTIQSINFPYSDIDIKDYNDSIPTYISNVVALKKDSILREAVDNAVHEIEFTILNDGTAPTGKMGLQIILPDELIFINEDSFVEMDFTAPKKPLLESAEERKLRKSIESARITTMFHPGSPIYSIGPSNKTYESHWDISNPISAKFFHEFPSLNHNLNLNFSFPNKLFVFAKKPGEYTINWYIFDETNVDPTTGYLRIIIT